MGWIAEFLKKLSKIRIVSICYDYLIWVSRNCFIWSLITFRAPRCLSEATSFRVTKCLRHAVFSSILHFTSATWESRHFSRMSTADWNWTLNQWELTRLNFSIRIFQDFDEKQRRWSKSTKDMCYEKRSFYIERAISFVNMQKKELFEGTFNNTGKWFSKDCSPHLITRR